MGHPHSEYGASTGVGPPHVRHVEPGGARRPQRSAALCSAPVRESEKWESV